MKIVIVKTYSQKALNTDSQHDCAGTWALAPSSKNEETQMLKAEGIEALVHYKDGEFKSAYSVAGYHTERRDLSERANGIESHCKTSVGVRFHLRPISQEQKDLLLKLVDYSGIELKDVRACRVFDSLDSK